MVFTLFITASVAVTLISGFSCDVNDKVGIVFVWQEIGCFRQVIQCSKSPAFKTEGVFSHHTCDPFPAASSAVFLTSKIQCSHIAKPQISHTFLLHCELSL